MIDRKNDGPEPGSGDITLSLSRTDPYGDVTYPLLDTDTRYIMRCYASGAFTVRLAVPRGGIKTDMI